MRILLLLLVITHAELLFAEEPILNNEREKSVRYLLCEAPEGRVPRKTYRTLISRSILSPTEMRRIASDLLRNEATASSASERVNAIVALCDMYVAIRMHPSYEQSESLRSEGAQVRRRLISASRKVTEQLERDGVAKPAGLANRVDQALAKNAQVESLATVSAISNSDAQQKISAVTKNTTGPGEGIGGGGPGAAAESWALVELIQRTIRPDFWDVTGGPGTIQYFAMRRVLVVRATTQVHEELAALLRSL